MTIAKPISAAALAAYRAAVVIDAHNDMAVRVLGEGYDPDVRHPPGVGPFEGHTDLPRLIESGITAQWLAAWVDASFAQQVPDRSYSRAVALVETIRAWIDRHPERLRLATTATDVRRAKADDRIAILIGVEGGHAIESSLDKLHALYNLGVRYLTLTWNNGNAWAGSSIGSGATSTGGLTAFGRDVVREMNRLGMLVDVSHTSSLTLLDVLDVTSAPVIASHSNARAVADHPRNLTDDELRGVAKTGGVVNVNFYPRFLDAAYHSAARSLDEALELRRAELETKTPPPLDPALLRAALAGEQARTKSLLPVTPIGAVLDHIDHIVQVAGIGHVGIGSDFDGISAVPAGLEDVTALPQLAQALLDRGYRPPELSMILGGNMLRVMAAALR